MERRHPQVVNIDELDKQEGPRQGTFASHYRRFGPATGSKQLGASLYEVEPGRAAFPFHWHAANEEAVIIVSGTGTMRIGDERVPVRAGDYIAMPIGSTHAHQLENTGNETLVYWCMSTLHDPEVCGYPDSKKIASFTKQAPDAERRVLTRAETSLGYWDGEARAKG